MIAIAMFRKVEQCFPNFFARRPHLASKNNHGSSRK